jgi:hypothetical protein
MFPQYDSEHIFDEIERGVKLFGSQKTTEKIEICLGGYALHRISDGAFWGSGDGSAYSLFIDKNRAEAIKESIGDGSNWEIIYVGGIWIDKPPVKKIA